MGLTIEQLASRIALLESQVHSLSKKSKKSKKSSAFNNFALAFTPHIRSALFNFNLRNTHNLHFKPTHAQIIFELSLMWNALTHEEKSHFAFQEHTQHLS